MWSSYAEKPSRSYFSRSCYSQTSFLYFFTFTFFYGVQKHPIRRLGTGLLLQLLSQYDICIYINFQGNRTINTVPVANTSFIYFIAFTKKIISICVKCHATPRHQPYSLAEFKRHRWSRWRRNPKNVLPVSVCSPSQFVPRLSLFPVFPVSKYPDRSK